MENHKKLFRKARMLQNIIKMQSLLNDSLSKINSLFKKAEGRADRKEILLLTQIANNLHKTQRMLEQLSRFIEKTTLESSSCRNEP
jgi:hypothetical protein